jgi:hypothetical protein
VNYRNESWGQGSSKEDLLEGADKNTDDSSGGEIVRALEVLFEPGAVVELRAFKGRETVSGYYDEHATLAYEADKLEDRGYSVYVTLNEVDPALLARASNGRARSTRSPLPPTVTSRAAAGFPWTSTR